MKRPFSDTLRAYMDARGMDGADLSRASGVLQATISRYVNGERLPRGAELVAIAKALRVDAEELLGSDAIVVAAESMLEEKTTKRASKKAATQAPKRERAR